ncbi:MAG: diacylglycerol/lipid kinase family protein [Actinomycetota bacterium]
MVNPTAGRERAARFHSGVARQLANHGHAVVDLSAHDAATALANARSEVGDLEALVVVGGDGVVQLGLNAVAGTGVPLGVIPVGSGNDNATGFGMPRDPRAALDLIVHQLEHRPSGLPTDALRVTSARGTSWVMATLSCGIDAVVNARANRMRRPQGSLRYPAALFSVLPRYVNPRYAVEAGDWSWEGRAVVVAVSNIGWFGGGMNVAPSALPDDGAADVVIGGDIGRLRLLALFPRIYGGSHVTHPKVDVRRARRVTITAETPRQAFADGEFVADLPVTVEVVQSALRVLRQAT